MRNSVVILAALWPMALVAQEVQEPLSAIDWLDTAVSVPLADPEFHPPEPPISTTALTPEVSVSPLEAPRHDSVGLLPGKVTGLPSTLWVASPHETLVALIKSQDVVDFPAMQSLIYTLLLAEAEAPSDAGRAAKLLLARIDKLTELGAVEQAQALVERAGTDAPELFARWFDLTLLSGDEDDACKALNNQPHLSPGYAARIYCLARGDQWDTAYFTYESAVALDLLTPSEGRILSHFLDPELAEEEAELPPPSDPSPLTVRVLETLGQPVATAPLPRAYARADLRNTSGWKAELEAAERLARSGALPENRLLGIYTTRDPAASGGIWDRVAAVQRFDTAMNSDDPVAVARTLPAAWGAMRAARLEIPFARLYGERLNQLSLEGDVGEMAFRIGLLSNDYERIAQSHTAHDTTEEFLISLAGGAPDAALARSPLDRAIADAYAPAAPPADLQLLLYQQRLGETILRAMALYSTAAQGDIAKLTDALAVFRAVGLEDTARKAALQLLLLERGV